MTPEARTERARELRRRQTRAEAALWQAVRGSRLGGLKFRRQVPVAGFFADFACEKARLIIELDGAVHDRNDQVTRDHLRQQEIETLGWCVVRFRNAEVLNDLPAVLAAIERHARIGDTVTPHPPAQLR